MGNWADTLIIQYEEGRKELHRMKEALGDSDFDIYDKKQLNSMISSMTYVLDWLKNGREPNTLRGIDKNRPYQRNSIANMDIFASLDIYPEERKLSEEEKEAVVSFLMKLSPRERQCFILHHAYMMSYSEIAAQLGVGRSTVQKYIERAKSKISCRADVMQIV